MNPAPTIPTLWDNRPIGLFSPAGGWYLGRFARLSRIGYDLPGAGEFQCPSGLDISTATSRNPLMAKPQRKVKKANHGARPANSKIRKSKRQRVKT